MFTFICRSQILACCEMSSEVEIMKLLSHKSPLDDAKLGRAGPSFVRDMARSCQAFRTSCRITILVDKNHKILQCGSMLQYVVQYVAVLYTMCTFFVYLLDTINSRSQSGRLLPKAKAWQLKPFGTFWDQLQTALK